MGCDLVVDVASSAVDEEICELKAGDGGECEGLWGEGVGAVDRVEMVVNEDVVLCGDVCVDFGAGFVFDGPEGELYKFLAYE